MMNESGINGRTTDRPPFTPTQWQELEHQALIYKYMVSGVPVPPELIFSIRRSLDSSLVSRLIPHQSIGWGCYQMGFGTKPDPEPGRCRRTDGKKWRCSREAHPDSKYCEKHMHRGRNRAKKTLDQNQTTAPLTSPYLSFPNKDSPISPTLSSSSSSSPFIDLYSRFGAGSSNSYPYPSSPKQQQTLQHASALSLHQNTSTSHFNVLASETDHKDFRSFQGIGERTLFPEASKSFQESPYHHQQALAAAMNDSYHGSSSGHHHHTYSSSSSSSQHQDHHQQQQCFVLGADIFNKPTRTVLTNTSRLSDQNQKEEEKDSSETKKSIHHFFGEDWAQNKNSSDSWLDLSSQSRLDTGS
ncbi:growth-regulating factor 5-like [Raphanus sativus]|uniref:Growth-regulating factor n=1 Tax=Raphanus sativus TaxID=3726 RepID=A0A6J0LJG5_RAPSA|nr:growth-regulating factor 5-like [Raphanus sativus]